MKRDNLVNKEDRINWIDLARGLAICCVILVHVIEFTNSLNTEYMKNVVLGIRIYTFALYTIGRVGVPLFLFLSGYLLLHRNYEKGSCVRFWKRNWLGLLITTEIWIIIYNVFLTWCDGQTFDVVNLLKTMMFVKQVGMGHMWYMPMIIGIYIFLPFVATVLQKFEWRIFRFPMLVGFVYLFIVPIFIIIMNAYKIDSINNELDLSFSGGVCGFMIVLGFWSKKGIFKQIRTGYLVSACAIGGDCPKTKMNVHRN